MDTKKKIIDSTDIMPERIRLVLKWLLENKDLLLYADTVKLKVDIKGVSVRGEITVLPDAKK